MIQNDIYVGVNWCKNWKGVVEIIERECCGGRKSKYGLIDCSEKGVVEAERVCNNSCDKINKPSLRPPW